MFNAFPSVHEDKDGCASTAGIFAWCGQYSTDFFKIDHATKCSLVVELVFNNTDYRLYSVTIRRATLQLEGLMLNWDDLQNVVEEAGGRRRILGDYYFGNDFDAFVEALSVNEAER